MIVHIRLLEHQFCTISIMLEDSKKEDMMHGANDLTVDSRLSLCHRAEADPRNFSYDVHKMATDKNGGECPSVL